MDDQRMQALNRWLSNCCGLFVRTGREIAAGKCGTGDGMFEGDGLNVTDS
jgi:hypothetical protein